MAIKYVQALKPGDQFVWRTRTVTVQSVSLVPGYHDTYVVIPTEGRKIMLYAGEKVACD